MELQCDAELDAVVDFIFLDAPGSARRRGSKLRSAIDVGRHVLEKKIGGIEVKSKIGKMR